MAPRPIIIDCDPGQDDAVMLFLALSARDDLDILGITAVAGNVPLALTERNTRLLCEIAGHTDIPIHAGCDRPIVRPLVTAEHVHGKTGIDGVEIVEPDLQLHDGHAVDFLVESLTAVDDETITLVPTGPLTNIAMALVRQPAIADKIKEIVLMGGASFAAGNITPSAEFNIYVDPHAADIVFNCGRPITVFGLDVTHQVITTPPRLQRFKDIGGRIGEALYGMLDFYDNFDVDKYGSEGGPLHDPCTIAYLLAPDLFELKPCNITIETASELTMGHTAVDFWHVTDKPKNALWAHKVDADGFYDLLIERISRLQR